MLLSTTRVRNLHDPEEAKHAKSAQAREVWLANVDFAHGVVACAIAVRSRRDLQVADATSANSTKLAELARFV